MTETVGVRAIIVDPRPLFCDVVRAWLTKGGYVVLSQVRDLGEAMRQVDSLHPDLVMVGPHLMEEGLVMCREMTKRWLSLKIIIFTAHADEPLFQADAAYAGVSACLHPETAGSEFLSTVAEVMAGKQFFSHEILSLAFQPIELTESELAVLRLMGEEKTDREIADALNLKFSTVRNHTQHILEKLSVHHRKEAVWRARHRGLV